jgi:hypothetical protein
MSETEYTLEPFRPEHLAELPLTGQQASLLGRLHAGELYAQHPSLTARVNGVLLACAGIIIPWKGIADAWMLPTRNIARHPKFLVSTVRRFLASSAEALDLVRIEAVVDSGFLAGRRFADFLGFERESEMPLFGPNRETYIRYVLFPRGRSL